MTIRLAARSQSYSQIAETIRRVRESYGSNWDPNLFRALDDVSRELGDALGTEAYESFLAQCGVPSGQHTRRTP